MTQDEQDRQYYPLFDPTVRATVLAHAIRTNGFAPPPGQVLGFALQIKQVEALGISDAVERLHEARDVSDKVWFSFTITNDDLERGLAMLRNPDFTGHPGKTSSLPLDDLTKLKL